MQLSLDGKAKLIHNAILKLEDNGWRFRVTRWQDRETILSHEGQLNHYTRLLHRIILENKKTVIEYLDTRAKKYIAICRANI